MRILLSIWFVASFLRHSGVKADLLSFKVQRVSQRTSHERSNSYPSLASRSTNGTWRRICRTFSSSRVRLFPRLTTLVLVGRARQRSRQVRRPCYRFPPTGSIQSKRRRRHNRGSSSSSIKKSSESQEQDS